MKNKNLLCRFLQVSQKPLIASEARFLYQQGSGQGHSSGQPEAPRPSAPDETTDDDTSARIRRRLSPGEGTESETERQAREISNQLGDEFRTEHPELVSYVSYLEDSRNMGLITGIIDDARENIVNWPTTDTERAAEFIRENFPGEEAGRNAFADALLSPSQEETSQQGTMRAPLNHYAWTILNVLVSKIIERKRTHSETSQQRRDLQGNMGDVAETVKTGARNLLDRFKQAPPMEKALMIAAAGVILKLLWDQRDKTIGKDGPKWKTLAMLAAAGIGLNYLSGKVSTDGKTLLNRLDMGTSIEQLEEDDMYKMFALYLGPEGAESATRSVMERFELDGERDVENLFALGSLDMRRIHRVWQETDIHARQELSIPNLIAIGIPPREAEKYIDKRNPPGSKGMYSAIKKLYWFVGMNYYHELADDPNFDPARGNDNIASAFSRAGQDDYIALGIIAMQYKYLKPDDPTRTYQEIMIDALIEREMDAAGEIEENMLVWSSGRLPREAIDGIRRGYREMRNITENAGRGILNFGRNAFHTSEEWLAIGLAHAGVEYSTKTKKTRETLTTLLGANFPFEIRESEMRNRGKIWMYGVPLEYHARTRGNDHIIRIHGVVLRTGMSPSEVDNAKRNLVQKAKDKLFQLLSQSRIPGASGIQPDQLVWNEATQRFFINRHVAADQRFGIQEKDIHMAVRVRKDNGQVELFVDRSRITDVSNLDESYRMSRVSEAIYDAFPALTQKLTGGNMDPPVAIEITKAETKPDGTIEIEGNIGGVQFSHRLSANQNVDAPTMRGLLSGLNIQPTLINAYLRHVAEDPDFHRPFDDIYDRFRQVSEGGFWSRVGSVWDTRFLGFIPTNFRGAQIGPIRETQLLHTLMHKKAETLYFMGLRMQGRTLGNFDQTVRSEMEKILTNAKSKARAVYTTAEQKYQNAGRGEAGDQQLVLHYDQFYTDILNIGYQNPDYQTKVQAFIQSIHDTHYRYIPDLEGVGSAHQVFTRLLAIYINDTRQFNRPNSLNPAEQAQMDAVITRITSLLDYAQTHSDRAGFITLTSLDRAGLTNPSDFSGAQIAMGERADSSQRQ